MSFAHNGEVRLYYEAFGRVGDQAVLMLTGAGRQSIDFSDAFCERIAAAGFRAIRFDPRDTGLSTAFADRPSRLTEVFDAVKAGDPPPLVYGPQDMADDAFAVLDAEDVGAAHLIGRSLGSGIAQMMVLDRPERILSLTLIIAFSRGLADAMNRDGLQRIEAERFADADAFVNRQVRGAAFTASPAYLDEARVADEARAAFARGVHPGGGARHFAAGIAVPDLRPLLAALTVPVTVIHGALDKVIPLSYAQETVAALPSARFEVFADMAHDGPPQLMERWADLFLAQAAPATATDPAG